MAKKSKNKNHEFFFINGKPASLLEVAESTGENRIWKSFLERHRLHGDSADRYLKGRLGDYLDAHEIRVLTGITVHTLGKWRVQKILQAEQLKGRWYYSVKSLISAIQSPEMGDTR